MTDSVMNTSTSSDSSSADSPHTYFYKYRSMSNPEPDEESSAINEEVRIKVGICAMNKKTYARPMKEILKRLKQFLYLEFLVFPDEMILNEPVENWPVVDCLISFYSKGFPLAKAISYAKMRKPLVINDLEMQFQLQDRRETYRILSEEGLDIPRHAVFTRDADGKPVSSDKDIEEFDDTIIVNGKTFHKPFVEKPVSAEDHNIYIYYPAKAGGGCQILFRKIGCRSSVYSSESNIRRTGSYIYEDFMPTDGTDVKVYTVGEEYAHAEARKSPVLDGKVERDSGGKELRYPVILSAHEKLIAKRVCKIFKQTVCGFDLLRANGKSLVCDVNGFSFVKTSQKYYDDCSQLLADMILQNLAPQLWVPQQVFPRRPSVVSPTMSHCGNTMELRCVIALIRHGDRTPKQKMKMVVTHQLFVNFYEKCGGPIDGQLKIKNPKQLQELLDITRILLEGTDVEGPIHENKSKLSQMKNVLEMYGHFSGINRKVQLKAINDKRNYELRMKFKGRNKKSQTCVANSKALLLILKWGGELTPMGKTQAEDLGRAFRCVYPGGQGEYGRVPGFGFLRLHSTYRHDLKMYASDEGRVQMTAAAFAKGLLALEGELTPILVSLVKSDKHVTDMLDTPPDLDETMLGVKSRLHDHLHSTKDFTPSDEAQLAPYGSSSVLRAMRLVKNPYELCEKVYLLIQELVQQINEKCDDPLTDARKNSLYHEESLSLMKHRWEKLEKDFKNDDDFDISLIPDIYDCVKYDYLHNRKLNLMNLPELYTYSKYLADIVIPLEYGITIEEKLKISKSVCNHFFRKIQADLQYNVHQLEETVHRLDPSESHDVASPHRHVRTRLYFTSESHVHSVIAALKHGNLFKDGGDSQWESALEYIEEVAELNYLTQIVLMQYENPTADPLSDDRFHIELFFSPGVINPSDVAVGSDHLSSDVSSSDSSVALVKEPSERKVRTISEGDLREIGRSRSAVRSYSQHSPTNTNLSPSMGSIDFGAVKTAKEGGMKAKRGNSAPNPVWLSLQPLVGHVNATSHLITKKESPKKITDTLCIRGCDIIDTSPSCHPLICLHSKIRQKQIESFLQAITSPECTQPILDMTHSSAVRDISESRKDSMAIFPCNK